MLYNKNQIAQLDLTPIMRQLTGLTFIECLIVISLSAILLIISVPGFTYLYHKTETTKIVNGLVHAIRLARYTALSQHTTVTICPSQNLTSCIGQWHDGIIIFTDDNADKKINGADKIVYTLGALPKGATLTWSSFGGKKSLQITPQGLTYYNNGTFTYCPKTKNPKFIRKIIINRLGKIRLAEDKDGDNVIEDQYGNPFAC